MSDNTEACFCFTWYVENYHFYLKCKKDKIESPSFVSEVLEATKWNLKIHLAGGVSGIYLHRHKDCKGPGAIEIEYEVLFSDDSDSYFDSSGMAKNSFEKDNTWGFRKFAKKKFFHLKRTSYLPKDTLTVCCKIRKSTGNNKNFGECVARTRILIERRSFIWSVDRFSSLVLRQTYMINSSTEGKNIMTLNLFTSEEGYICLEMISARINQVFRFRFCILDAAGNAQQVTERECIFCDSQLIKLCIPFHLTKYELLARKDFYLRNDVLTLRCDCFFSAESVTSEIESTTFGCIPPFMGNEICNVSKDEERKKSSNTLRENLKSLYSEQMLCDTKLKTKTRTFPAHKNILSARSSVFKAKFTNGTCGKIDECVNIVDLDDDTVERMLIYMYTDELQGLQWGSACKVYTAAAKYEILSLKEECSSFLKANLSPSNACDALVFADAHKDDDLKKTVQHFIIKHDKQVINSEPWKRLMETCSKLANDTMILKYW
ncbi:TD and POZ domain-containing protein 1 [Nephila pilipes]|uniref:TD and POZ domain-containing protein 1 n=1 Tax=Nephila pilipes TaxID=299642 RepID=A0A8X6QP77_NEPPI|nr:TD and POZ domain-containing protein 1 [Nephila pilipes]